MTGRNKNIGPLKDRRHEKFALGLADLMTQEDAYKAAGYVPDGGNATRLAKRPEVQARVRELQNEAAEYSNVRRERIVVELDRTARANILDYYEHVTVKGKRTLQLRDITKLPREIAAAIQSVKVDPKTGITEVKLHDRNAANTTLLKYLGGLPEAPSTPTFNIFNVLSSEDQRSLADALEALTGESSAAGETAPSERGED